MVKLILGVAGTIGAGKDAITNYLKDKYSFQIIRVGDLVREEIRLNKLQETRENEEHLSKKRVEEFGVGYWARTLTQKIESSKNSNIAINGVRRPAEATLPKKLFGDKFKLIFVDANTELRFKRLKARKRPGDPKTHSEFKKQEQAEWKIFDFEKTIKLADFTIKNETTLEDLYKQLDELIAKLLK